MSQRVGRNLARRYGIMVTDASGIRRRLPSPKAEEPSEKTRDLRPLDGPTTIFDVRTVKKSSSVNITDTCSIICEMVGDETAQFLILHKKI